MIRTTAILDKSQIAHKHEPAVCPNIRLWRILSSSNIQKKKKTGSTYSKTDYLKDQNSQLHISIHISLIFFTALQALVVVIVMFSISSHIQMPLKS